MHQYSTAIASNTADVMKKDFPDEITASDVSWSILSDGEGRDC